MNNTTPKSHFWKERWRAMAELLAMLIQMQQESSNDNDRT
jgi:hypothetical protein